jgi:hypothetical protein
MHGYQLHGVSIATAKPLNTHAILHAISNDDLQAPEKKNNKRKIDKIQVYSVFHKWALKFRPHS